jgi:hypothetical protein
MRVDVRTGRTAAFATGFDHPIAVLSGSRGLLVADYGRGVIYRIRRR